jgi:hypothetical protein
VGPLAANPAGLECGTHGAILLPALARDGSVSASSPDWSRRLSSNRRGSVPDRHGAVKAWGLARGRPVLPRFVGCRVRSPPAPLAEKHPVGGAPTHPIGGDCFRGNAGAAGCTVHFSSHRPILRLTAQFRDLHNGTFQGIRLSLLVDNCAAGPEIQFEHFPGLPLPTKWTTERRTVGFLHPPHPSDRGVPLPRCALRHEGIVTALTPAAPESVYVTSREMYGTAFSTTSGTG